MEQRLPPSVEDREEAELGAEMLGISSDRPQSFGSGVKQDVVDRSLVVMGDGADLLRHSEDDVEVRYGEEFGSSVLKPLGTRQPSLQDDGLQPAAFTGSKSATTKAASWRCRRSAAASRC